MADKIIKHNTTGVNGICEHVQIDIRSFYMGHALSNYFRVDHMIVDHYELGEYLGEGSFSVVRSAVHKVTGEKAAIKIITL